MMTKTFFHNTFTWFRTWAPLASLKFEEISQLNVLQIKLNDHIFFYDISKIMNKSYRIKNNVVIVKILDVFVQKSKSKIVNKRCYLRMTQKTGWSNALTD